VDTIPTSANKEDHVAMGPIAARKAAQVVANTRRILAVEAVAACQALEFHRPLTTSPALAAAYDLLRTRVAPLEQDRMPAPDIEAAAELVGSGDLAAAAAAICGTLE
jgi:histidine ammonia-lyase